MECKILKASDYKFRDCAIINTIEDLKKLSEKYGNDLILNFDDDEATIWIYDDYIE